MIILYRFRASHAAMTSARNGSLDVPSFADSSLRNQSIISLDGFRPGPPSPLPGASQSLSLEQDILYEFAESIQIEGAKVSEIGVQ